MSSPAPPPDPRSRRRELLWQALMIALAVLAARYGIPLPPPQPAPQPPPAPPIIIQPPVTPPPTLPPPPPPPEPDKAIVKLSFRGVGCTATVIGPQRVDSRWWVLTAAHCCEARGQRGSIAFLDGRRVGVSVVSFDRICDAAWLVTDVLAERLPYAFLAKEVPPVGTKVWHAGHGIDSPGNREDGTVAAGGDSNGQCRFRLSVSSGDSGGGIISNEKGEVISCVCCTSARGRFSDVWGTTPERARQVQASAGFVVEDVPWEPIEIPLRMPPRP